VKIKSLYVLFLLFAPAYSEAQNPVSFIEEYIDFQLTDTFFTVNGIYVFKNNSSVAASENIAFPFATETALIDTMRVFDLINQKNIKYQSMSKGVSFGLNLLPHETLNINIFYRQPIARKNTYILTTTKYWGKPLEKARYSLTALKNIKINSFSYQPDTTMIENNKNVYLWKKYNFQPNSDFEIQINK
jgi:hypothetical protein